MNWCFPKFLRLVFDKVWPLFDQTTCDGPGPHEGVVFNQRCFQPMWFHRVSLHYIDALFLLLCFITAGSVITHQVCEHDNFHLECNPGQIISVLSALYGRQTSSICAHGSIETHSCAATSSLDVIRQNCNGHRTCDIMASNDVFGDPCRGTFKYLDIQYKCDGRQCYSLQLNLDYCWTNHSKDWCL